jgi:hypothetical protein
VGDVLAPERRDERGLVIVMMGMSMVVLMIVAALAVDIGYDRQLTRHLQVGTDAGALAGALELPDGDTANAGKAALARTTAAQYALNSIVDGTPPPLPAPTCSGNTCTYVLGTTTIRATSPYTPAGGLPAYYNAHNFVHVEACKPGGRWFSQFLGAGGSTRCRSAVARNLDLFNNFARGLIALDPTACGAMSFSGSSTTNLFSDGAVIVESSCPTNALDGGGSAWEVEAGLITVVGEADIRPCSVNGCLNGTPPIEGVIRQGDPLGTMPAPTMPTTNNPAPVPGGANPLGGPACDRTYQPGRYTNELSINSNETACFAPGLYWLEGGFRSNGGGELYGTGVLFYNHSGDITLNGNGEVRLQPVATTAPASDPLYAWRGVTLFQARTNTSAATINGNNNSTIGTVYMPSATLNFSGNAGNGGSPFITGQAIARTVDISGNGYLTIDAEEMPQGTPPQPDLGLYR